MRRNRRYDSLASRHHSHANTDQPKAGPRAGRQFFFEEQPGSDGHQAGIQALKLVEFAQIPFSHQAQPEEEPDSQCDDPGDEISSARTAAADAALEQNLA